MIVSVCVIAYNEEKVLGNLLNDILNQTYPHKKMEVVLIDSISQDRTLNIMQEFQKEYKDTFFDVKIAENPKRRQAAGWNTAITIAEGEIIIRIDAHAAISRDFVERNMGHIEEGENVVGGPRPNIAENDNFWGRTLLIAEESMFGSGIAVFRRKTEGKKYVNSVFHGAYRKEVFQKAGMFNEELGRTEDNEMHYRIRQAGYQICFEPDIISYQYVRNTWWRMIKQKYGNGYWIGITLGVCPGCLSWYHFVPFLFVMAIVISLFLAMTVTKMPFLFVAAAYIMANMLMTLMGCMDKKRNWSCICLPFIFLSLHLAYGVGTMIGIAKIPCRKKSERSKK